MSESWFISPNRVTLPLSEGHTITVRKRLNTGEYRQRMVRMSTAVSDGELQVNRLEVGLATITAFLLDWTLTGPDGKLVEIRGLSPNDLAAVLDNLDFSRFAEIREAIDKHEDKMTAERLAEKNAQAGAIGSSAISPSPSDATGASSGSAS